MTRVTNLLSNPRVRADTLMLLLVLLQIISAKLTYVAQLHGTTLATASALPTPTLNQAGTVASASMAGIIR